MINKLARIISVILIAAFFWQQTLFASFDALRPRAFIEHEQIPAWAQTDEVIYEVNTRTLGKTFGQITDEDILRWKKEAGATMLWVMGPCEIDPYSEEYNKFQEKRTGDTIPRTGSAYAIKEYKISEALGGEAEYMDFVRRANALGVGVMLEVVPNHMGAGTPLVNTLPELFMTVDAIPRNPKLETAKYLLEHKDPRLIRTPQVDIVDWFVPPGIDINTATTANLFYYGNGPDEQFQWMDTLQFNWTKREMREYMREVILHVAYLAHGGNPANKGGIRFDMIFYTLRQSIRWFWFRHLSDEEFNNIYPEKDEFWKEMIPELRRLWPNIVLLGEMYGSKGHGNPAHEIGLDILRRRYHLPSL